MKIIRGNSYERFILKIDCGDKPFSIFRTLDILYYNSTVEKQTQEFFINDYDHFNSGEKELKIGINSEEERYELSYLFTKNGFRIRNHEYSLGYRRKRVYFLEEQLNSENSNPSCFFYGLNPYYDNFSLYLRKKDTKKFLDFLKVLSSEYGYKTVYQDITVSRNYYRCCNKNNNNYRMNYILK